MWLRMSRILENICTYSFINKEKYHFNLYHYVIMTKHVYLVIEPSEGGGVLSEIMKGINLSYGRHYKRKYSHTGHFWQDR